MHLMISMSGTAMNFVLGIFLWVLAFYLIFLASRVHLKKNPITGFFAGSSAVLWMACLPLGDRQWFAYFDSVMNDPMEYQATLQLYFMITTVNVLFNNIICGNFTA